MKKNIAIAIALVVTLGSFGQDLLGQMGIEVSNWTPEILQGDERSLAWETFSTYREAAKEHDLKTITLLTHQLSPTCIEASNNPSRLSECEKLMDSVYLFIQDFTLEDFAHVQKIGQDIIISTEFKKIQVEPNPIKATFIFVRENGILKFSGIGIEHEKDQTINFENQ